MTKFAVVLALVIGTMASGQNDGATQPPLPAPGRMVDIGGWRLHLNCTGKASGTQPTVILEPGVGDFSVEWSLVQPKVAEFARVCSYDRAGDGWSEMGPHPRTMHQIVYELYTLLNKAGIKPPFLLVGQSYGGVLVRLYASQYRAEVAGMILVDGGRLNPRRYVDGKLVIFPDTATGKKVPPVQTANPLKEADIPPGALAQMQSAARQSVATANTPPREKLPEDAQRMRTWALGTVKHIAAYVNPFENEELAFMITEEKQKERMLGDIPFVVLTAGLSDYGSKENELEKERLKVQAALSKLSSKGRQVIVENSGHHIQIEQPDVVVKAIREVLDELKK